MDISELNEGKGFLDKSYVVLDKDGNSVFADDDFKIKAQAQLAIVEAIHGAALCGDFETAILFLDYRIEKTVKNNLVEH